MKLVTHDDRFHADDIFATAVVRLVFGSNVVEIVRSRDNSIIASADIVLDVGGVYDPTTMRFDHHQAEGAGVRDNGIPYASFGLVWKEWGAKLSGSQEAADIVDSNIVQAIDAGDNGVPLAQRIEGLPSEYVLNKIAGSFGATWKESDNVYYERFVFLVNFAEELLKREIIQAQSYVEAVPLVEKAYVDAVDKRIIILDDYYPWKDVLSKYSEPLFVISPSKARDKWRVNAMQEELFVNKKSLPEAWAGLSGEALQKVTGVADAQFCHRKLFMAAAESREGAIALAQKAIEQ